MKNKYTKIIILIVLISVCTLAIAIKIIKQQQQTTINAFRNNYISEKSRIADLEISESDIELFVSPYLDTLTAIDTQILSDELQYKQLDDLQAKLFTEIETIQNGLKSASSAISDSIKTSLNSQTLSEDETKQKEQILTELEQLTLELTATATIASEINSEASSSAISESITSEESIRNPESKSLNVLVQETIDQYNNYLLLQNLKTQADTLIKTSTVASTVATSNASETTNSCEPYYAQGFLIANKKHCLEQSFNPGDISAETRSSWEQMQASAQADGINLHFQSGFRSYDYQVETYNYWVSVYGEEKANQVSAKPGYSEHQTGLAIDVSGDNGCLLETCFIDTPEGTWLAKHAHEYGFIIRYMPGKEDITGYTYEPWHIRYVGVETATEIYNQQTTLEEYLGVR
ncbi:M15 family metallopeptidase [Mollicutes bacterium LVI A0039]|nr:M15 family metallopeptidase [Mollicutes bacterium LVI A0039]